MKEQEKAAAQGCLVNIGPVFLKAYKQARTRVEKFGVRTSKERSGQGSSQAGPDKQSGILEGITVKSFVSMILFGSLKA